MTLIQTIVSPSALRIGHLMAPFGVMIVGHGSLVVFLIVEPHKVLCWVVVLASQNEPFFGSRAGDLLIVESVPHVYERTPGVVELPLGLVHDALEALHFIVGFLLELVVRVDLL